jgi:hypothetical protein
MRVDLITARDVADVLRPLQDRPETLKRVRGRIEKVIDMEVKGAGLFDRANPATLAIHALLSPAFTPQQRRKARKAVEHHEDLTL